LFVETGVVIIHLKLDHYRAKAQKGYELMSNRFKRSITLLLALAMVLALGTSVAFASVTGKTTSNLNKRSSPSVTASKLGTIKKGSTVTVVSMIRDGEKYGSATVVGDWYKLSDGSFVSADYVTLSEPLEDELPPDDEEELPPEDEDGDEVELVDDEDGDGITIDDGDGIVVEDDEDLEEIPVEDEEETPPDDLEEEEIPTEDEEDGVKTGTVNASSLNMRAVPASTGAIVAKLPRNTVVTVTAAYEDGDEVEGVTVTGKWYAITYNGKKGYVSADYIRILASTGTASTVKVPLKTTKTVYKTTQKVTVYKLPTTMASTNGTLSAGSTVTVQKTISDGSTFTGLAAKVSGKWYQIGTSKYIQAKYVTTSTASAKTAVEIPLGTALVTTTAVRQRAKPSTSAAQLGKLEKGATIVIVGAVLDGETYNGTKVTGNWVQIKGGGFISADYVALP